MSWSRIYREWIDMRNLRAKITKLEKQVGTKTIAPDDRLVVIMGHRWEKEEKAEKRKAELIEKYGPECLDHFLFVDFPCFCDRCHPKNSDSGKRLFMKER